jgi:hypothetical protein
MNQTKTYKNQIIFLDVRSRSYFCRSMLKMKQLFVIILFSVLTIPGVGQSADTASKPLNINGNIGLTNNGISIIPTFSLNAPAALFNFSISKNRLSFDPDVRLALDGRKGGMLFWFRYKFIQQKKFKLNAGIHPAYNFALRTITENGKSWEITQARRFIAWEVFEFYSICSSWDGASKRRTCFNLFFGFQYEHIKSCHWKSFEIFMDATAILFISGWTRGILLCK